MEIPPHKKPDFTPYTKAADIGRGTWFMNHLKTFNIIDNIDVESMVRDINLLRDKFPCHNCRKHFADFCKEHPPRIAADADLKAIMSGIRPENLARWFVDAHNAASAHKFEWYSQFHDTKFRPDDVKYEHVREFFDLLGEEPCTGDCEKPDALREIVVPTKSVKIVPKTQPSFHPKEAVGDWKSKPASSIVKPGVVATKTAPKSGLRIRIVPSRD